MSCPGHILGYSQRQVNEGVTEIQLRMMSVRPRQQTVPCRLTSRLKKGPVQRGVERPEVFEPCDQSPILHIHQLNLQWKVRRDWGHVRPIHRRWIARGTVALPVVQHKVPRPSGAILPHGEHDYLSGCGGNPHRVCKFLKPRQWRVGSCPSTILDPYRSLDSHARDVP